MDTLNYEILPNNSNRMFCAQFITMFENNNDIQKQIIELEEKGVAGFKAYLI